MIITKIQGGLGNQMFQYAYGKNLSSKYNTELRLDKRFYDYQGMPKREFGLNKFPNIFTNTDMNFSLTGQTYKIDDDFKYKDLTNPLNDNYYLDGYWQSEKYFKESIDLIREDFQPSKEIISKLIKTPLIDTNTISLHVRRTDYVTSNGYHPVQSIDYYNNAIDLIGDYDNIFIFSDDLNWCKDNLKFNNMIFISDFTDIEDLHLMSLCRHNIIANSSFSWWGAWLNDNKDKKVIAPSNWFGSMANLSTDDIIPDSWIKI
jgi:hypothetical protein